MENNKIYSGWDGVKKIAKEYNLEWQDVCDLIYKKFNRKKTTFRQILMCAEIKYEIELVRAGGVLKRYYSNEIIKRKENETEIHYVIRSNFKYFKDYLEKYSKSNTSINSEIYKSIRDMYAKICKRCPDEVNSKFNTINMYANDVGVIAKH